MVRITDSRTSRRISNWWITSSVTVRIIVINLIIFMALHLAAAVNIFRGDTIVQQMALQMVELPANLLQLAVRPWTALTYMFAQYDLLHLLFNMLWLYWFGFFFAEICNGRRIVSLYVAGGLTGAASYLLASNLVAGINDEGVLIGSSAAVLAVVTATALLLPSRTINFLFIGPVKIKWVALVIISFDVIGVGGDNGGGHLAHLGGMLAGGLYYAWWRMTDGHRHKAFADSRAFATAAPFREGVTEPDDEAIDRLLDKIRRSGYLSLTASERNHLLSISGRLRARSTDDK